MASPSAIEMSDLKAGMVVHFFDTEANTHKNKYCVIVGISEDLFHLLTAYINTEIDFDNIGSPELEAMHYEIKQRKYNKFLNRDSYINCVKLIHRFQYSFLEALNKPDGKIVGRLNIIDFSKVKGLVINGGIIMPFYLELYRITN